MAVVTPNFTAFVSVGRGPSLVSTRTPTVSGPDLLVFMPKITTVTLTVTPIPSFPSSVVSVVKAPKTNTPAVTITRVGTTLLIRLGSTVDGALSHSPSGTFPCATNHLLLASLAAPVASAVLHTECPSDKTTFGVSKTTSAFVSITSTVIFAISTIAGLSIHRSGEESVTGANRSPENGGAPLGTAHGGTHLLTASSGTYYGTAFASI